MAGDVYDVLFLCTGNSARSILAEAILDRLGQGRIRAHSAGSRPQGRVHPMALDLLVAHGYDVAGLRSKSWDEFARPGAPALDFVFTTCDNAAGETCPIWPGGPVTTHWGVADPADFDGPAEAHRRLFARTYTELHRRIERFTRLPIARLDRMALAARLEEIAKNAGRPEDEDRRIGG